MLSKTGAPAIGIGAQCFDPYDCEFMGHCWKHVPDYSVFDLARARFEKKIGLWKKGIARVQDIPDELGLSSAQEIQVQVAKSGRAHIDLEGIVEMLAELSHPLFFLDFETINPALPPYDGLKPFQHLTFQASVHIQDKPDGPIRHAEFLDDGRQDSRSELVEFLVRTIGPKGTVIAYSKGFEGARLRELAQSFPASSKRLLSMRERLWDLRDPFRKSYVHPKFEGSQSIKDVLPVMVPSMSYKGMPIHDGGGAQNAYINLLRGNLGAAKAKETMRELKVYCGQDTLAMVKILEKLRAIAKVRGGSPRLPVK
jgi:hypothetical protein